MSQWRSMPILHKSSLRDHLSDDGRQPTSTAPSPNMAANPGTLSVSGRCDFVGSLSSSSAKVGTSKDGRAGCVSGVTMAVLYSEVDPCASAGTES